MRQGPTSNLGIILSAAVACFAAAAEPSVEFNRDVRPILTDHCFQCHGPDEKQRKGNLRLDISDGSSPARDGGPVVVDGQPEKSELWRRITSPDSDERMPPPDKGRKLNEAEIATIRAWIAQGAKWQKHWSLLPVVRPAVPVINRSDVALGPLDTFILARLDQEGLSPSLPADSATLLRRATLALTGLPPTPEEIDSFLADASPDAYERVVDRLLASPRYGERMAVPWLDAARYADTSGYQSDGERFMWRWRDWVIEALNADMPFDRFTIEQLAGDLLPQPTLAQRIATGFHRNHRGNAEGGIIPEEYAVEYVADRVETTAAVWLGLTLGCCRCHDHKYDPFSQRDFYSLFAFFNNVPEKGRAIKLGNSPPYIQAPTRQQAEQLSVRSAQMKERELRIYQLLTDIGEQRVAWQKKFAVPPGLDWKPTADLAAAVDLDGNTKEQVSGKSCRCVDGETTFTAGAVNEAVSFDGKCCLEIGDVADFGFFDKFALAAWIFFPKEGGGTIVSRMTDAEQSDGYQLALVEGKLQLNLSKRWLDDALRVETAKPISADTWHHVLATYDGSRVADGVELYVDGELHEKTVLLDELNQSFAAKSPLRIGGGGGPAMRFRGKIDEVRVYSYDGWGQDLQTLAASKTISDILTNKLGNAYEHQKLRAFYLQEHAPPEIRKEYQDFIKSVREFTAFREGLPTVMVMEEMPSPRESHILIRGQYDKPGERVEPNTPAELPPLSAATARNRLGLARWLVDPANPLTSRVIANRIWQLHFGTGLVKTAEDFGRQGEWPSHPELLDWLAAEFMHVGWDVKRLHRTIVTSGTFRQASRATPELLARDPDNRLLARGPRLRLSAEMVRDQALLASGLLVEETGGPSVRPYQPLGLWSELTGGDDYQPGQGAEQVRRSLYTFWKRTIPPPALSTFDAPTREFCTVRESRTNTPLQALALLNEQTHVTAAKALAERIMREAATPEERISRAMLRVVGRPPVEHELAVLKAALARYRGHGDETAAYTLVCSTILNLDEAVTRQ
jgi:mono/diheme cytochrome c family protein